MSKPPRITAEDLLRRVLSGLGAYREGVVLVGGFARDLYRHVDGFADLAMHPPGTNDIDFAVPDPLQVCGDSRLHDVLLRSGLRNLPQFGLNHQVSASVYYPVELADPKPLDPHVEFITPLHGPDRDGNARPQRDDLFAFALRFVDLLLDEPIAVSDPVLGRVRIPHPLAFIIQKTRIRPKRQKDRKAAKDQADAFFVVVSLKSRWIDWRMRWDRIAHHEEQGSWLRDTQRLWEDLYHDPTGRGALEVAQAYPGFDPAVACRVMAEFRETFRAR
jgi:hypothetical protein